MGILFIIFRNPASNKNYLLDFTISMENKRVAVSTAVTSVKHNHLYLENSPKIKLT